MKTYLLLTTISMIALTFAPTAKAQINPSQLAQFSGEYSSPQWEINRVCEPDLTIRLGSSSFTGVSIKFGESPVFNFENIDGGRVTTFEHNPWGAEYRYRRSVILDSTNLTLTETKQISQKFIVWTNNGNIYTSVSLDPQTHSLHVKEWDDGGYTYSDCTYLRK